MAARRVRERRKPAPRLSPAGLWTRNELAAVLNKNPMTITKWIGEGLPVEMAGGPGKPAMFRMAHVWEWGLGRERQKAGVGVDGAVSLALERAKLARAQTKRQEWDLRKREGEVVEVAEVAREWALVVASIRSKLLAMPSSLAPRVAEAATRAGVPATQAALDEAVRDVLRELAAWRAPEAPAALAGG